MGGEWDGCVVDCGWDVSMLEIIGAAGLIGEEGEDIIGGGGLLGRAWSVIVGVKRRGRPKEVDWIGGVRIGGPF